MTGQRQPQWSRMLDWLRERGPRGVHTFELRAQGIGNPSQRVAELEERGHVIDSVREEFGPNGSTGARYTLRVDAVVEQRRAANAPADPADTPPQLFAGVEVGSGQRSAIFDCDMDEAA